jgi:hypothetical protein
MPADSDIPTHLNIRLDPKLRYLAEIACQAENMNLTEYVENALRDSFKNVSVDRFPELSEEPDNRELSPAERLEKFKKRATIVLNPLSDVADGLWSEYPSIRLQLLAVSGLDHLMSEKDKLLWDYLFSRKDLKLADGKLNHKLILSRWEQIKQDAMDANKKKGRSK